MTARDLFWDSTGIVRPPWRLFIFAGVGVVSLVAVNGTVVPLVSWLLALTHTRVVLYPWILLASIVVAHVVTFHLVDSRGWSAVGLDRPALRPRAIGSAALLGALAVALPSLALVSVGWLRIESNAPGSSLGSAVSVALFLAPAALWEEMVFRGYAFSALAEWWGSRAALGATSLVFGLVHFQNAGSSALAVVVVVLAGVFLGAVLLATHSLWAAFAAHLAWNWTLVGAMHTAVSGIPFATPDYRMVDAGPDWATGGVWGPEGGLPAALGLLSATFYLYWRRRRREES